MGPDKENGLGDGYKWDLLRGLMRVSQAKRASMKEVLSHAWFSGTKKWSWAALYHRKVKPRYVPKLVAQDDTKHFDKFDEDVLRISPVNLHSEEFKDF